MQHFKPTYLYIKQHSISGLKYFGKTTKKDPIKYLGSGTYWRNHIKKYGKRYVTTLWYKIFNDEKECIEYALKFSIENNIVKSNEWANQMLEDGINGKGCPGRIMHETTRILISKKKFWKKIF
jgi:hypothetical protein